MASIDFTMMGRLVKAFTPTQPITLPDLLSGRLNLLFRLQDDTHTPGQHILLYGNRGVGKTSIARVLAVIVQEPDQEYGMRSILVSCDSGDTYGTIWRKVLREVLIAERPLGFTQREGWSSLERFRPEETIESPTDLRLLVESLPNPAVIVIDEFDRVRDENTRMLMADTLKLFSDSGTRCTVVLVGVGQSIDDLIRSHESISRNVDYVPVDPMDPEELAGVVVNGFSACGLEFEPGLDLNIAKLSQGYPHYTHLLGLWAGRCAVQRGSVRVTQNDLRRSIPNSIQNAAGGIRLEYDRATDSTQPNNLFKQVLLACAMADKDARGRFALGAVREPLQRILNREVKPISYQRHLATFCDLAHGRTLIKTGRRRNFRWRFSNPQLIPFIYLQGISDGLISSGDLP